MAPTVSPITDRDVERVGEFLHAHLNGRLSAATWARAVQVPWSVDAPNHGFMLLDGNTVVGAYVAFYSERKIAERIERFCNLGAWCVLPEHRFYSLRLLNALLAQSGYHFTDLSPSGNTVPVNTRLRFELLDTRTALIPNLPWPSWPGRTVISSEPALLKSTLSGRDLEIYCDHAKANAARHVVLIRGRQSCYVIFRRDRRKKCPFLASILHVSNLELFHRTIKPFARYLLFRYGVLATLAELRIVGYRPSASILLRSARPRMFRSPHLASESIDYLYSELVCVAW